MTRQYILEVYHEGEALEQRVSPDPFVVPDAGEEFLIYFSNPNYTEEYGYLWVVKHRTFLLMDQEANTVTVQLHCEPVSLDSTRVAR